MLREAEQTAVTVDKGHGRLETRELTSTTLLAGYLDGWADCCQAFRLRRARVENGVRTEETAYGIASLSRAEADAGRLLSLVRGHWMIENRLHWVRDETMGEDRCRVRTGAAPESLAALRNAALHLVAFSPYAETAESRAEVFRHLGSDISRPLQLLGFPPLEQ